jgi:hypothetical protein
LPFSLEQPIVIVPKRPAKHGRDALADGTFARPHRADDHDVTVQWGLPGHQSACAFAATLASPHFGPSKFRDPVMMALGRHQRS